ncbi:hypothetical protein [Dysosmobacter sp.]|uniref:hypothetical protein n=1 Tax=Dysosmobacter sp. TaxID=2591382 RepID=UPI002A848C41|nr:hypothetical protein [Dysosmobacter sp.]MDY3281118.1 hypothetical protein [Dysosmobacter sp.]
MKKPWFVWLSLMGFMGLYIFLVFKQFIGFFQKRPFDMSLWVEFCGRSIGLLFLLIMVPSLVIVTLISAIFSERTLGWNISLCALWLYIYLIGVFLTLQLYRWARKNELIRVP